jgi:Ca-activated chloride channel homolog
LKILVQICLLLLATSSIKSQQFYLRGEVRDEKGNLLQNVSIKHCSTGYGYHTGNYGSFGIPASKSADTLEFSYSGYQKEKIIVSSDKFISVTLKILPATATNIKRDKLVSLTKDLSRDAQKGWYAGDETYASLVENNFIETKKYPVTGIALNIDRASYSNTRIY